MSERPGWLTSWPAYQNKESIHLRGLELRGRRRVKVLERSNHVRRWEEPEESEGRCVTALLGVRLAMLPERSL